MNHSIWYPGIAKLNSRFGFPNGYSVLASLFTSFKVIGFENLPNLIVWILLGGGIFAYLIKKNIPLLTSLSTVLLFLFTPPLFWQSYNMGTDLPCASFMLFGLLALYEKHFGDAVLFLSLSAVFKSLGIVALILSIPYIFIFFLKKKGLPSSFYFKIFLSFILFSIFLIRIFIATGNPLYPFLGLNFAHWGIAAHQQQAIGAALEQYSGVKITLLGLITFIPASLFFPKRFMSSYWFSPFFIVCLFSSIYLFIKNKYFCRINFHAIFITSLIFILLTIWLFTSPLIRFILGVLIFINIILFVFVVNSKLPRLHTLMIYGSLFITLALFAYNVAVRHIARDVIPLFNMPRQTLRFYPVEKEYAPVSKIKRGFSYSKTATNFCSRAQPPCINRYGLEDEDTLIREYRKYNKK